MEPFATMVALGIKTIETRVQKSPVARTKHRGELLICSSKKFHPLYIQWQQGKCTDPFFMEGMKQLKRKMGFMISINNRDYLGLTLDKVVGRVELTEIRPMTSDDQKEACVQIYPEAVSMVLKNPELYSHDLKGLTNGFHLGVFDINL